jgi:hypothetical protein
VLDQVLKNYFVLVITPIELKKLIFLVIQSLNLTTNFYQTVKNLFKIIKMDHLPSDALYEIFDILPSLDSSTLSKINKKFFKIYTKTSKKYYKIQGSYAYILTKCLPHKFHRTYTYSFNPLTIDRNDGSIKFVEQGEMIVMNNKYNNNKYKYIGTMGVATCIAFFGFNGLDNISFMIHFDNDMDVCKSMILLNNLLKKCIGLYPSKGLFKLWIKGGYIDYSENLLNRIIDSINKYLNVKYVIECENILDSFMIKSAAIDTESGEYFDYIL